MPQTRRHLLLTVLLGSLAGEAFARDDAAPPAQQQLFPPQARVAGAELVLNGTGVRAVLGFQGFEAGLYLSKRVGTAAQVLAQPGPRRLRLRMLNDVPAVEFVKALKKGIARNSSGTEMAAIAGGVQQLADAVAAVGEVRNGDVIDLDFDPQRGLLLSINGASRSAPIANEAVHAALLRSFIGERPYDKRLRAGLLGQAVFDPTAPAN